MNDNIPALLSRASRIAVVGLSDKPYRSSYGIAETLLAHGYEVIPVNPGITEWNGIPAWPDLRSVPFPIDIVNVFRRSEHVASLVDEAIAVGAKALWTQSGIADFAAASRAEQAGMQVVMDRCIAVELARS
jgi:predicted CoA-binding protein